MFDHPGSFRGSPCSLSYAACCGRVRLRPVLGYAAQPQTVGDDRDLRRWDAAAGHGDVGAQGGGSEAADLGLLGYPMSWSASSSGANSRSVHCDSGRGSAGRRVARRAWWSFHGGEGQSFHWRSLATPSRRPPPGWALSSSRSATALLWPGGRSARWRHSTHLMGLVSGAAIPPVAALTVLGGGEGGSAVSSPHANKRALGTADADSLRPAVRGGRLRFHVSSQVG